MFNPAFAVRDATPHLPTAVLGPSSLLPTASATSYFLLARYFLRETTAPPFLDNVDRDTVAFGRLLLQPARFLWRFILVRSLQSSPDTDFGRAASGGALVPEPPRATRSTPECMDVF